MKYIFAILSLLISGSLLADEQSVILSVPGMNCPVCPITVKKSIENVTGVKSVDVSYESKSATVLYDDQLADIARIQKATENAGYPSEIIKGIK
ncbi:MAG: cation transporter [Gammaproteobacteria bacterium]|nr:cation transporter [Gammaproteobacteria bacterium]